MNHPCKSLRYVPVDPITLGRIAVGLIVVIVSTLLPRPSPSLLPPPSPKTQESNRPGAPAADAVARRVIVLNTVHSLRFQPTLKETLPATLLSDLDSQRRRAVTWLKSEGLWDDAMACRPWDRRVLSAPTGTLALEDASRVQRLRECLAVLLLALGLVDDLPPPDGTPPPIRPARGGAAIPHVGEATSAFVRRARLRPSEKLLIGSETAELWLLRSILQQKIDAGAYPEGAELAAIVSDLKPKMAEAGLELRAVADGPSVFAELIRYSVYTASQRDLAGEPIDDDFPVFGKAYRDLRAKELELMRQLASERLQTYVWLGSGEGGEEDTETESEAETETDSRSPSSDL